MPVANDDILADLRLVASSTGRNTVGQVEYQTIGKYNETTISQSPYNRRFDSWTASLNAFVDFANAADMGASVPDSAGTTQKPRETGRDPSLRLRWKVLQRDRFKCCACGASPAITPDVELHVDHIKAWSKGGETVAENLQTLCLKCNLGKSNI